LQKRHDIANDQFLAKEKAMKSNLWILWGFLLVLAGGLFLLDSLNLLELSGVFWGVVLGIGGLAFLSVYFADREHWWALIPGCTLLSVSALILLEGLFPDIVGDWGGSIVLGGIGLSFLLTFLTNRENWWALIPGGVMVTLAFVVGLDAFLADVETGGVFFLGLGLTFALVGLIPTPQGYMRWAFIPAVILLIIGLLIVVAMTSLINYLWALALIAAGLFLLVRALRTRRE
jgi:hypothetical protein